MTVNEVKICIRFCVRVCVFLRVSDNNVNREHILFDLLNIKVTSNRLIIEKEYMLRFVFLFPYLCFSPVYLYLISLFLFSFRFLSPLFTFLFIFILYFDYPSLIFLSSIFLLSPCLYIAKILSHRTSDIIPGPPNRRLSYQSLQLIHFNATSSIFCLRLL